MMNVTVEMMETNMYLRDIILIISYIFISTIIFGALIVLCMCVFANLNMLIRIFRSCCIKCDCCDYNVDYDNNGNLKNKVKNSKIQVVVLPTTKVMDAY